MKVWTPAGYQGTPTERARKRRERRWTLLWTGVLLIAMAFLFWIQGFP